MYTCYTLSITETLAEFRSDVSESGSCMNWLSHQKRYQPHRLIMIQWNLDLMKDQGTDKICSF